MLLALDTATRMASLALYDEANGWILGEETWYSAFNHTVELLPRLVRLFDQQEVSPGDLTSLVVSLGPGSFTGLRIGLALAKGLALSQAPVETPMGQTLPLVGVPTLDVVAEPHKAQRLPIWALLQAGRGRVSVGHYIRRKGRWRRKGEFRITTFEELCDEVEEPSLFCGEIDARDAALIRERLGLVATIAPPAASLRRAAYLAELGWQRLGRGDFDDPASLSPIYLHHPQIDG